MSNQPKEQKPVTTKLREFFLTTLSVNNSTSVVVLTLIILAAGLYAYTAMPKEQFPEIVQPQVYINTPYPGNSAVDMENLVTRPIEKEIKSITGVKEITSTSLQGFSVIIAEFNTDVDIAEAMIDVKDAVDKAMSDPDFPKDLPTDPTILDVNFSELPIVSVNLSGEFGMDDLRAYAEYLQDKIEALNEVSEAKIKGALDREVRIDVRLPDLQSRQVSFYDIEQAIAQENFTLSGGELLSDGLRRAVRVEGQFENVTEIQNLIVKSEQQNPITLKDVADVTYGYEERSSYARSDGNPVISLDVVKRSGENLLSTTDKINQIVDEAKEDFFPESLKVSLFNDQSVETRRSVSNLENSIISGVILVILVLLFFLGPRSAMFVGVAIPLSMVLGILFLYLMGVTLNMVVLFSLILALGMLVDNAIVVVENIYRYMQEGYDNFTAAKLGAGEVAVPIIASTATTLAAFIPLAFWPGLMGEFMKYLPITLILVLVSSLFIALVINPVLTALFLRVSDEKTSLAAFFTGKGIRNFAIGAVVLLALIAGGHALIPSIKTAAIRNVFMIIFGIYVVNFLIFRPGTFLFQNYLLPFIERIYDKFIRIVLKGPMPYLVFGGTVLLLVASLVLLGARSPKVEFFPTADPIYVNVFVEMPIGTDIEATNDIMKKIETKVSTEMEKYGNVVESILAQVGEGTSDPNAPPEPGNTPHKGRLTVSFVPSEERGEVSTADIMTEIRNLVQGYAGVRVIVDQNASGPPSGKPINLEISGDDLDELIATTLDLKNKFESSSIRGYEELKADIEVGKPELIVDIDRAQARRFGLSTQQIAGAIRTSIYGREVSRFKIGEDEYPIVIRLQDKYRYDLNALLNQRITFRNNRGRIAQIPISSVADASYTSTYSSVKRKDLKRVVTISSNVFDGYNANEIISEMESILGEYEFPRGITYEFTGEQQEQAEAMSFLTTAFLIAFSAIFFILITQFNSINGPFIIMMSVIFSTIGVFLGYVASDMNIVIIMTGIGIVSLAGVVVNNAIVLIDYINLTRDRLRDKLGIAENERLPLSTVREAIITGGKTRLRPVLLTAITTVLGLIPLALGININFTTIITDFDPEFFMGGDSVAFWGVLAWTVIYGLSFATFLTLIVIPVMYYLLYRMTQFFKRILGLEREAAVVDNTDKPDNDSFSGSVGDDVGLDNPVPTRTIKP